MFKSLSILFVFLFLASCGKSGGGSGSGGDSVSLEEIESGVIPSAALNFNVNVRMDNEFTTTQSDKIHAASDLIRKVVASDEFRRKVLSHSYNGKKGFVDNGGLSNAQVYKAIIEGWFTNGFTSLASSMPRHQLRPENILSRTRSVTWWRESPRN